ncbi:MAG: aconitate hydratase [Alphaproteobacteria bacterium]|nr:aconitate hydratase [Alphaproteobacteria bacterium]
MTTIGQDSLKVRQTLEVAGQHYGYYSLPAAEEAGLGTISTLPFSLKILIENLLRHEDGKRIRLDDIRTAIHSITNGHHSTEIAFIPARVLMQDFTGVPAIVDLAAMRDAMVALKGDPTLINPLVPVDLVIDHSVMVDASGTPDAFGHNTALEFQRNHERYAFLRWGQEAFQNFRVVPPGTGICHQVNLEYLAQVVWVSEDSSGQQVAYPDTLVGTDSHTTMVNSLSVLGWGVGGIEAEAAMLGQAVSMLIPNVVGFKLTGKLPEGTTATDLVLTVTNILRAKGVVGKFVEFYGDGLDALSLADRATVANMAPEYGATCGFFPIDQKTIEYLAFTGRDPNRIALVEGYAKAQGLWRDASTPDPCFSETLVLDLDAVRPTLAGPKRPQDKVLLSEAKSACQAALRSDHQHSDEVHPVPRKGYSLAHGHIVIAAITSCTNTSNPTVMIGAGLLARKARAKGLQPKPWVKTSLAPGSQVVTDYLEKSGLDKDLDALGFNLVGYGCTTCIGNSGPLQPEVAKLVEDHDLTVCSVLSGNRNFEGRINAHVKANYLASPPLVVAYALAGSILVDLTTEPLGIGADGKPVYLKDVWPTDAEIQAAIQQSLTPDMFRNRYADVFKGGEAWQKIQGNASLTYPWENNSTYVKNPPYFTHIAPQIEEISDIKGARILVILGDSVTTDHISPAGSIKGDGPAGHYLHHHGVEVHEFNSYGARRGNHEVMMRGTFANIRLSNEMLPGTTGGITTYFSKAKRVSPETLPIYTAAMKYQEEGTPLVVVAGKEYGTGSSRDWAAKGPLLLGVKAVIAESFERIHRSNLVGMGILPLTFLKGESRKSLALTGEEIIDITGVSSGIKPGMTVTCTITRSTGQTSTHTLLCRIDTQDEMDYFLNGGILPYVLRNLVKLSKKHGVNTSIFQS